ncbi:hypothetical protein [Streptomyces sp. NPDC057702]|uniref:AMIN-like domain-containing (lipo)protein n=1 Tax=unclassified Streptomyces TaxID=2593676 RepID=UPI0036B7C594
MGVTTMRRWGTALAAIVLASAGLAASVTTANAAAPQAAKAGTDRDPIWGQGTADPSCAPVWGSGDKTAEPTEYRPLENVRAGRHACFDRLVLDVRGSGDRKIGYRVGYVKELRQDGSGDLIKVGGGAILEVRAAAPSYDPETGTATYQGRAGQPLPGVNLAGYQTFKDARFGGSFEGDTQIGLGVRAKLPFRVTQTANHLIVDVAHSWTATR